MFSDCIADVVAAAVVVHTWHSIVHTICLYTRFSINLIYNQLFTIFHGNVETLSMLARVKDLQTDFHGTLRRYI